MRAFLWGVAMVLILAGGHLWPKQEDLWLVVLPDENPKTGAFLSLLEPSSRLVDIVDGNTIIISPSTDTSPADLYNMGALIVVNAAAGYGCSPPPKNKWAKSPQTKI